jgi:hypothetical protein
MRACLLLLTLLLSTGAWAQERRNAFDDPFLQVTSALPGCPVPRPPGFTEEESRQQAHVRAQHGTSCHRVGRWPLRQGDHPARAARRSERARSSGGGP